MFGRDRRPSSRDPAPQMSDCHGWWCWGPDVDPAVQGDVLLLPVDLNACTAEQRVV